MNKHPILKIIFKNTFTLFNFVNIILACMVAFVGSWKNILFIFIAIANTLISIINEIRAYRIVSKMRLLTEQRPTIEKNGKPLQVAPSEVQVGDIILLGLGDQISFDSVLISGALEVNEAFITGEQDNIEKRSGDQLTSGSFIVAGSARAQVKHVGDQNFINKLETSASFVKTADSQLFTIMNNIVKYISYALIPIGALLLWSRFQVDGTTTETAITSTVAALINMIPEGLILLTSSVLALATIRLSKKQVLVQDLYSIETLARVDCIALDKTGTLTTGDMTFCGFILPQTSEIISSTSIHKATSSNSQTQQTLNTLQGALELILAHSEADNATSTALKKALLKIPKKHVPDGVIEPIPFSSDRKYSGVKLKDHDILMGAPRFVLEDRSQIKASEQFAKDYRILAVIKKPHRAKKSVFLGFVLLADEIRSDAPDIIDYFYQNNVAVKIISGDDLPTVSTIAERVGVKDLRGVDLSTLKTKNFSRLVQNYSIFTRVKPAEKRALIEALKQQGKTVAMTGDGVNDILAMKEADCSIAIGAGSDAARRAAKIVLLNSDFSAIPPVINEGRQSINNLERSTTLFLTKTVYAAILAVLFVFIPFEYPFSPIEMTLLNCLCIGIPGFILALEPNTMRIKNQFVTNIKKYSIPTGILISLTILILSIIAGNLNLARPDLLVFSACLTFTLDFILLYRISRPLNAFRATLLLGILVVFLLALFLPFTHNFFFAT